MLTRQCSRLLIINDDFKLLLFKYQDEHHLEPFWATVGGELRVGESYLQAAQRELYEETGLQCEVGELLKEHEAVFAVARSLPAVWQEKYYLVRCDSGYQLDTSQWTDEEQSTIQKWHWWSLNEMRVQGKHCFKPEWLPELFEALINTQLNQSTY